MSNQKRYQRLVLIIILMIAGLCASMLFAQQSSDNYSLDTDVLSGGGRDGVSTNYFLLFTLGQPTAIGESTSANYQNYTGFWYTISTIPVCGIPFTDIPSGFWAEEYIKVLYCNGITTGYPDNTYRPASQVNRAQMAAFIVRAKFGESFTYNATPHFIDVPDTHWAFKYVQKMYEEGITTGYPDGTYRPASEVNRAQMAAFIARAFLGIS